MSTYYSANVQSRAHFVAAASLQLADRPLYSLDVLRQFKKVTTRGRDKERGKEREMPTRGKPWLRVIRAIVRITFIKVNKDRINANYRVASYS